MKSDRSASSPVEKSIESLFSQVPAALQKRVDQIDLLIRCNAPDVLIDSSFEMLIHALNQCRHFGLAIEFYDTLTEQGRHISSSHYAEALAGCGQLDRALDILQQARKEGKLDERQFEVDLARIYRLCGKTKEVVAHEIRANLLLVQETLADIAKCRRAVNKNPNDSFALSELISALINGTAADLEEALTLAHRLASIDPYEGNRDIAVICDKQGDLPGTIEAMKKVIELDPDSSTNYYYLGCLHVHNGDLVEAKSAFQEACIRDSNARFAEALADVEARLKMGIN